MKLGLYTSFAVVVFAALFFANAQTAQSELGGSVDSIERDTKALSVARHAVTSHPSYNLHELNSTGNTVREYVSPAGIVFGIAWDGPVQPDLAQLLGGYATEYHEARRQMPSQKGSRQHLHVEAPNVIVEKWGHMRSMHGRAYAPALIPTGVNPNEIR